MTSPLITFLASVRKTALSSRRTPGNSTLVLGNSSCDLDSWVSALVLSFFYSLKSRGGDHQYIPLLNLPTVPSSELWRLRPEFGTALSLATKSRQEVESENDKQDANKGLLANLITIADLTAASRSSLYSAFAKQNNADSAASPKEDVILVDHNAPSIAGYENEELSARFSFVGCIDHHVDESFISSQSSPRTVQTGIGSCTSLVVKHLRDENLWPTQNDDPAVSELAQLALAPILVDTFNLKASGDKCSDTDREAVHFLESQLNDWNRDAFFEAISESKANSLNLLTMREIFERDYKEWTETAGQRKMAIGIPSLVRSLQWLVDKAGSPAKFADAIHDFAQNKDEEEKLDLVALIAKSSGPKGEFRKELAVIAFGTPAAKALEMFEEAMKDDLKLQTWQENDELLKTMEEKFGNTGAYRVWWQGDTEKSRKQVAPALRDAAQKTI